MCSERQMSVWLIYFQQKTDIMMCLCKMTVEPLTGITDCLYTILIVDIIKHMETARKLSHNISINTNQI